MLKNIILLIVLFMSTDMLAQKSQHLYQRPITGIENQWHSLKLPDGMFGKSNPDLSDLRIIGVTPANDTIEAPYLLRKHRQKTINKEVSFKRINQSHNGQGYFYTFQLDAENSINQINLEFGLQNFDWQATLQGSQDQKEWFTILENERILSIKNSQTNYKFTQLNFTDAQYPYYRLQLNSQEDPKLVKAKINLQNIIEGKYIEYPVKRSQTKENKANKQTEIFIDLGMAVPINKVQLEVNSDFDYYRPLSIQYLTDSVLVQDKWKYNYKTFSNHMLSSLEDPTFGFKSMTAQKFKIIINNHDNAPLNIQSVKTSGYLHELTVRFTEAGEYALCYGNPRLSTPKYDIQNFMQNIPDNLAPLQLGTEIYVPPMEEKVQKPLFENKAWLWGVMVLIIGLLGWFTLRMMQEKS